MLGGIFLRKVIGVIIITVTVTVLSACTFPSKERSETENQLLASVIDIYSHHHSTTLYQFGKIVDFLSDIDDGNKVDAVKGMIYLYLKDNPATIPVLISNNENYFTTIVQPEIQENILAMYANQKRFISKMNTLLLNDKMTQLVLMKDTFTRLYELERNLNDNRYNDKEEAFTYKKSLDEMNTLLTEER